MQLALIPRIEVTPLLTGSGPAENRLREYTRLGCNQTYYDIDYEKTMPDQCKELLHSVDIWVFDGATGKFGVKGFTCGLIKRFPQPVIVMQPDL